MPSTVLTTSSIGCAMSDSTSSGEAPGKLTRTETVGKSTEGKRSTPSLKNPAVPITTSDNTIIDAKTRRRIQISANFCITYNDGSLVNHFDSLPRLQVARIDHHFFTDVNAGDDFSKFRTASAGCNRALECFSVLHDDHFLNARKRYDRVVRHRDRHFRVVSHDLRVRKRAGPQCPIISDVGFNHEYAVLLRDHRTQAHDLAGIDSRIPLNGYTNILTSVHLARFTLGNLGAQAQRVHFHDVYYRRARREIFADAGSFLLNDAIERRNNRSVFQLLLCERQL